MKKIIAGIALVVSLSGCASTIETGYRGVTLDWGKPTGEVKPEGLYWYAPFAGTSIVPMNVQIQSWQVKASAVSRDLQKVDTEVTLNANLDPGKVVHVYGQFREDYAERLVGPTVQETVKSITARFSAEELITRRNEAKAAIENSLHGVLEPYGVHVDQVLITDFQFSKDFAAAIEAKVTAQQNLITAKTEADTAITKARGQAESQKLQHQTLTPMLVQLKAIDKWDGHLPQVTSGGTPFLNLSAGKSE
jgi:regulator of protease activity HflC (stomatin/prohibitin superfamily)